MVLTHALLLITALVLADVHATVRAYDASTAQATASPARTSATFTVTVPDAATELVIDGKTIPGDGTSRTFETPPLAAGAHRFTFTASWRPNSYTTMTRTKTVSFRAGERVTVDLTIEDPADRVRVQYVPTPSDIADEMVKLAGVSAADVVYEPGCGDARITIAAIKRGAKRGICVDIDAERVEESRAKVKESGLEDKIDVRLGDALDVRDLSAVTVVLLYMGDHFNLLLRPVLWRQLPVGARVVSHRFEMGDWKPEKTVTVSSDEGGGDYVLHLWTMTEEVKKRTQPRR
jgi:uncharacterized protein (TIGR03000 family)